MPIDPLIRARAVELVAAGECCAGAAAQLGLVGRTVQRWAILAGMELQRGLGGVAEFSEWRRSPRSTPHPFQPPDGDYLDHNGRINAAGRVLIGIRLRERRRPAIIARELGVHRSTVGREIVNGSVNGSYRSKGAEKRAQERRHRPKPHLIKLKPGSRLWDEVVTRLNLKQSPEQISGRLRHDFPGRDDMQVSPETIYQALYVQGAGALRHELSVEKALRSGRTTRKPQSKLPRRSNRCWIGEATIDARPAEADDRAVPGHWEGDLIIGGGNQRSALITLFERTTRFALISRIHVHDTETVTQRLSEMAARLPASLWRSLTWDQGVEMSGHAKFTVTTNCPVFFCDPHSPWQRPTNENGNGLIRDFFPKGTNFAAITDNQVNEAEHLLNTRPRKVLAYATPAETLEQLLTVASQT